MRLKWIAATVIALSLCTVSHAQTVGDALAGQWTVAGMSVDANGETYLMMKKQGEKPRLCVLKKADFSNDMVASVYTRKCFTVN